MRIAICDDEQRELSRLSDLMTEYQASRRFDLEFSPFQSGTELLCGMKGGAYDVILLDVVMPGFSGLQAARELRELDQRVKIIFLTSSQEFAVESYSVGAYGYLLKPAASKTLFPLLDRARLDLEEQQEQGLLLKGREGVVYVPFSKLEYVEVINKTVSFHLTDGVAREVTAALADFEGELLSHPEFLKIHRSYLVNLGHVQAISAQGAVTKEGHTIPISRLQYTQIKETYMRFLFDAQTKAPDPSPQSVSEPPKRKRPAGPWRVLLVDDEPETLTRWVDALHAHGCVTQIADSGTLALHLAEDSPWDCVLLDVLLPGEDGFTLCARLQALTSAPVVFLSCLTDARKQVQGFSSGGADYITKDTDAELFWAKVETRIRLAVSDRAQLSFGPLVLDLMGRRALIEEAALDLTPTEFELLWKLSEDAAHIFTPEALHRMIWGAQPWDGGQMVQKNMSRLRRKLEKAWSGHCFVETVWGQGYRFVLPPG